MKKNKRFKAAVGLSIGIVLLTSAVFANYDSANGYSTCKEAIKKVMYTSNLSADITAKVMLDENELYSIYATTQFDLLNEPSSRTEVTEESHDGEMVWQLTQNQDGYFISKANHGSDYLHKQYSTYNPKKLGNCIINTDEKTFSKAIGFVESVGDIFVGDLKNNLVPIANEDGAKTYALTLTRDQMPTYVNSGVSLLSSLVQRELRDENSSSTADAELKMLMGSGEPYVKDINLVMTVDKDGVLNKIKGNLNFIGFDGDGGEHTMSTDIDIDLYDFGETVIERIPEDEIKKIKSEMVGRGYVFDESDDTLTIEADMD